MALSYFGSDLLSVPSLVHTRWMYDDVVQMEDAEPLKFYYTPVEAYKHSLRSHYLQSPNGRYFHVLGTVRVTNCAQVTLGLKFFRVSSA